MTQLTHHKTLGFMHMGVTIRFLELTIHDAHQRGKQQDWFELDGKPVSNEAALDYLQLLRKEGYECVPTCDNVDERGVCQGHDR